MSSALDEFVTITEEFDARPTLPITASVLARHPALIRTLAARGVEFAVHGLLHNDHSQMPLEEQRESITTAMRLFNESGVRFTGFRGPYLRANSATDVVLRELGFTYNSTRPVLFSVLKGDVPEDRGVAYRRVIDYYRPADASAIAVRPSDDDGLVQIPVSLPDDEILVDRLRLSPQDKAAAWRTLLLHTHEHGELFTLQLHPERIGSSVELLRSVLKDGRALTPHVWIATLQEIAAWWSRRARFSLQVEDAGPHEHDVHFEADPDGALLVRGVIDAPSAPWYANERVVEGRRLRIRADRRPVVAVSSRTLENVARFLREEGYAIQQSDDKDLWGAFVDVTDPGWREKEVLAAIEAAPGPVLRVARWPQRARSALSITGDVDAITLFDFASRMVGR
ncbi:MAG: polysaccharide deacetylase family protein [Actinobacteria bacterium]|nr:polysaccharide deacetylase family protein [Actinomycetota bacterium]